MKSKLLYATMAALAVTWAAGPAAAQTKGGEADANVPYKPSGTKEEQAAGKAARKEQAAAGNKAGTNEKGGDAKAVAPTKATGTKEEQAAEKAARKQKAAADNKAGTNNKGGEASPKQ